MVRNSHRCAHLPTHKSVHSYHPSTHYLEFSVHLFSSALHPSVRHVLWKVTVAGPYRSAEYGFLNNTVEQLFENTEDRIYIWAGWDLKNSSGFLTAVRWLILLSCLSTKVINSELNVPTIGKVFLRKSSIRDKCSDLSLSPAVGMRLCRHKSAGPPDRQHHSAALTCCMLRLT